MAFVALRAVVMLLGGINTLLIWLMNMEPHCVEFGGCGTVVVVVVVAGGG